MEKMPEIVSQQINDHNVLAQIFSSSCRNALLPGRPSAAGWPGVAMMMIKNYQRPEYLEKQQREPQQAGRFKKNKTLLTYQPERKAG